MPNLSIIIPTYNRAKNREIARCLEAIRLSTYSDYELIVVDGDSQDETVAIAKRYADKVIELKRRVGRAVARDIGMRQAKGDILVFTDSDNIIRRDSLFKISNFLRQHPEVDAVVGIISKEHPNPDFFSQYKNLYMNYIFQKLPDKLTFLHGSIYAVRANSAVSCDRDIITDDTERGQQLFLQKKRIILLRDLEVVHFKKYDLLSLLKNDFIIPFNWAGIFIRYKGWKQLWRHNTGYLHSSKEQLLGVILAPGIILLSLLLTGLGYFPVQIILLLVLSWFILNLCFFAFFLKEKGIFFTSVAVPFTFLDNIIMAFGILCGFIKKQSQWLLGGRIGDVSQGATSDPRPGTFRNVPM